MQDKNMDRVGESTNPLRSKVNHRLHKTLYITAIVCLVVASCFALLYLTNKSDATADLGIAGEKEAMIQTQMKAVGIEAIPAIDASAPARTETATFALG
ncbi:MAG: hypothetical protein HY913_21820 [Desulfomonile tiedjei]|nr:hypothetical protein [Desulfomonile tiedjei]